MKILWDALRQLFTNSVETYVRYGTKHSTCKFIILTVVILTVVVKRTH